MALPFKKTVNQTFSLPLDLSKELHIYVKTDEMSYFVSEAIKKELDLKKEEFRQAYLMANEDEVQIEAMKDWECTLMDGSNEW